jgi:DNA-binding transcriptional LysR family regulator
MHARVLRYLDEVVRSGSIRKAAERLHVASTAINRQILGLEDELGAPIFERINNRLKLTPIGEIVLEHVRTTLKEHEALRARIEEFKGVRQGEVAIATTGGLAGSLMPVLVEEFRARYPGIIIKLFDMPSSGILSAVANGDADLGLAYDVPDTAGLRDLFSSECRVGAVVHPDHPLAHRSSTVLAECIGFPLIFPAKSMSIRGVLDGAFLRSAIEVSPAMETTSIALMCKLVTLDVGVALLNSIDVIEERERGAVAFVPLRDAAVTAQTLKLVARARSELSPVAELMASQMASALNDVVARRA